MHQIEVQDVVACGTANSKDPLWQDIVKMIAYLHNNDEHYIPWAGAFKLISTYVRELLDFASVLDLMAKCLLKKISGEKCAPSHAIHTSLGLLNANLTKEVEKCDIFTSPAGTSRSLQSPTCALFCTLGRGVFAWCVVCGMHEAASI